MERTESAYLQEDTTTAAKTRKAPHLRLAPNPWEEFYQKLLAKYGPKEDDIRPLE